MSLIALNASGSIPGLGAKQEALEARWVCLSIRSARANPSIIS